MRITCGSLLTEPLVEVRPKLVLKCSTFESFRLSYCHPSELDYMFSLNYCVEKINSCLTSSY